MYTKADFCTWSVTGPNGHARCPKSCSGGCYSAIQRFQEYLKGQQRSKQRVKNVRVKKVTHKHYKGH